MKTLGSTYVLTYYLKLAGTSKGAAWLRGCGVALIGCGVVQTVARRLAVGQARVRISARHPRGGPLPSGSNEEIKNGTRRVYKNIVCMLC